MKYYGEFERPKADYQDEVKAGGGSEQERVWKGESEHRRPHRFHEHRQCWSPTAMSTGDVGGKSISIGKREIEWERERTYASGVLESKRVPAAVEPFERWKVSKWIGQMNWALESRGLAPGFLPLFLSPAYFLVFPISAGKWIGMAPHVYSYGGIYTNAVKTH